MIKSKALSACEQKSCAQTVAAFLDRVAKIEPVLNSFRQIDEATLYRDAARLDAVPLEERGLLHGMLVAVKEVYDVAGYRCEWGTAIHAGRQPVKDGSAIDALHKAGAIIAGITVSTEYAMSAVGPTVNPFDPKRSPGASSQGSAAAVGSGLVDMALGSQTIGSIIRPASYCGCIGMKPTWDAIDVAGSMPLSPILDHVGFMCAWPEQGSLLLSVLAPQLKNKPMRELQQITMIEPWYEGTVNPDISSAIKDTVANLRSLGHEIQTQRIPEWIAKTEAEVLDVLLAYDMAKHHGVDFDKHADKMTDRIKDYISRGRKISEIAYQDALDARGRMVGELEVLLNRTVGLMPSTTDVAPLLEEGTGQREPQRLWTLAGFPAMSVPIGVKNGLPLGVQIVAPYGQDYDLLDIAKILLPKS